MLSKSKIYCAVLLGAAMLTGCAQPGMTGTSYSRGETRQAQSVQFGTVESVRPVTIEGDGNNTAGTVTGAVVGGLLGRQIGGGSGRDIATAAGAVAGGVAGSHIQQNTSRRQGVEVTVRLEEGGLVSVVQEAAPNENFRPGDRVRVLGQGRSMRVAF